MNQSELTKRIKELDTGKRDPESRRQLALKLHKEGYPPTSITQMMKRVLGRGVPLTIFGKDGKSNKSGKSKISAAKVVQTKIARQITAEANEKLARILETGKLLERSQIYGGPH